MRLTISPFFAPPPHLQRTSKFFRHLGPDISAVPPKSIATALRMAPLAVELPAELGKGKDRLQKIDFQVIMHQFLISGLMKGLDQMI